MPGLFREFDDVEVFMKEDSSRSQSRHSRVPRLKPATLEKLVSFSDGRIMLPSELPDLPDGNLHICPHQHHNHQCEVSLNKLGRWQLIEEFRHNIQSWNRLANVRVSAYERSNRFDNWDRVGHPTKPNTTAYHSVAADNIDTEIHKYPRAKYGNGTLADPVKLPKKRRQKRTAAYRRSIWPEYHEEPNHRPNEPTVEISYVFTTPSTSLSLHEKYRKTSDRNKERLKARWGRCKKMADWNQETSQQVWEFYEVKEQSQMPQQPEAIFQQNSAALPLADFLIVPQPRRRKCDTRRKRTRQPDSFFSELGTGLHSDSETEWSEDLGPSTSGNSAENSEIFAPPPPPLMNLIPTEVQLISDSLDPYRLQLDYGHRYWECSCFPRRFCVSIGDAVSNVMRISHGRNFAATAVVNVICVVECLPASEDEVQTCLSSEDGEELTLCRVWLNGLFSDSLRATCCGSAVDLDLCHTIDDLLKGVALMVGTYPQEYFLTGQTTFNTTTMAQSPSPLGPVKHADCAVESLAEPDATNLFLRETRQVKMVQRQITALETFMTDFDSGLVEPCGICTFEAADSWCLTGCRHWFCRDCWQEYLAERIRQGAEVLCCPTYRCTEPVDMDLLRSVLPLQQCEEHSRRLTSAFLRREAHRWVVCPQPTCGRLVRFNPGAGLDDIISCGGCGTAWCSACGRHPHWPATCQQSQLYKEVLKLNGDDIPFAEKLEKITQVQVKPCPKCSVPMEKSAGCNHMSCVCGQQFCWSCLKPWANSHYNCPLNSTHGYQDVFLVDVKSSGGLMSRLWYQKCAQHHKFFYGRDYRELQRLLRLCIVKLKFPEAPELSVDQLAAVDKIYQDLLIFYKQTHQLLEHLYLWLSFTTSTDRCRLKFFCHLADRLQFVNRRIEEAAFVQCHDEIGRQFDRLQFLSTQLVLAVLKAKKAEKCRRQQ